MKTILAVLFSIVAIIECSANVKVTTPDGTTYVGQVEKVNDVKLNVFKGIRYAQAPVDNLRFKKPVPPKPLREEVNATEYGPACIQTSGFVGDEDCLFLNLWAPSKAQNASQKLSVMVFIHGGSFTSGTASFFGYDSHQIASLGNVIGVSINYRLAAFGFLFGGSEEAPGNVGIYDALLALKWVKNNIESFGGDPDSVTFFGESAGSEAVSALLLSPETVVDGKPLFKRAIMQSGAINTERLSTTPQVALEQTKEAAKELNCLSDKQNIDDEVISCLKGKSATELRDLKAFKRCELVYETKFLPKRPAQALRDGSFNKVDLLFGVNDDEGSLFVKAVLGNKDFDPNKKSTLNVNQAEQYIAMLYNAMSFRFENVTEVLNKATKFYLDGLTDSDHEQLRKAVSDALGEPQLVCPTVLFGQEFGIFRTHFVNLYSYRLTYINQPNLMGCQGWMGVCHASDLTFVFGYPMSQFPTNYYTETDIEFSKAIIKAWTDFAKTGILTEIDGVRWEESIDSHDDHPAVKYMRLHPNNFTMVNNGYRKNCDGLWGNVFE